jgi:hypothetical protein
LLFVALKTETKEADREKNDRKQALKEDRGMKKPINRRLKGQMEGVESLKDD